MTRVCDPEIPDVRGCRSSKAQQQSGGAAAVLPGGRHNLTLYPVTQTVTTQTVTTHRTHSNLLGFFKLLEIALFDLDDRRRQRETTHLTASIDEASLECPKALSKEVDPSWS